MATVVMKCLFLETTRWVDVRDGRTVNLGSQIDFRGQQLTYSGAADCKSSRQLADSAWQRACIL